MELLDTLVDVVLPHFRSSCYISSFVISPRFLPFGDFVRWIHRNLSSILGLSWDDHSTFNNLIVYVRSQNPAAMANLNSSFWYHLYIKRDKTRSLAATNLSSRNETMGATLYKSVDKNNATQRWQWFGINSTTYVLRCEVGGPDAFLGTKHEPSEKTPGQTQAVMVRGDVSDDSVYWTVSPWEDGTFFMTNGENGTDWHLEKMRSGSIAMSSNVTAPQDGQRWSFEAIEAINDDNYSTIQVSYLKL